MLNDWPNSSKFYTHNSELLFQLSDQHHVVFDQSPHGRRQGMIYQAILKRRLLWKYQCNTSCIRIIEFWKRIKTDKQNTQGFGKFISLLNKDDNGYSDIKTKPCLRSAQKLKTSEQITPILFLVVCSLLDKNDISLSALTIPSMNLTTVE